MPWAQRTNRPPRLSERQWRRLVSVVIARDRGVCHICGRAGATTADHVLALANGGTNDLENLKAAHKSCNERKGRTTDAHAHRPRRRRAPEAHPGDVGEGWVKSSLQACSRGRCGALLAVCTDLGISEGVAA